MADITDQHDQTSPTELDDAQAVGNGSAAPESRGVKRQRPSAADDDDDDDEKGNRERRKIEIKFISDKSRRHITFSKRKAGIMKKVGYNCPRVHVHAVQASKHGACITIVNQRDQFRVCVREPRLWPLLAKQLSRYRQSSADAASRRASPHNTSSHCIFQHARDKLRKQLLIIDSFTLFRLMSFLS